ncbi:MAG: bis(5'-nucleosyl)-tetraphosphatase (symmetrical) YqeK [Clostridia bacterium]|nr:bis(5'-nucleosyl)-tetraphosphatase (symmetrical) YqeK [Clostridia bacterium]
MESLQINEAQLFDLRCSLDCTISSDKRRQHILRVEKCAVELGRIFLPREIIKLQVAALLHDITKELPFEEQIRIAEEYGVPFSENERMCPKIFHARTAALIIPRKYPQFADPDIISAVAKHTTGDVSFSTFEKIIFLADFMEEGRTYEICRAVREDFFEHLPRDEDDLPDYLDQTVLKVLDATILILVREKSYIAEQTFHCRNHLLVKTSI